MEKSELEEEFQIFLGFNQLVFFPGHPVTGVLFIKLTKPKILSRIGLNWFGCEQLDWVEGLLQRDNRTVQNMLFQDKQTIFPDDSTATTKELSEGLHKFPFTWNLPENLPSTYIHTSTETNMPTYPYVSLTDKRPAIKYTLVGFADEIKDEVPVGRKMVSQDFLVQESYQHTIFTGEPVLKRQSVDGFFYGKPAKMQLTVGNGNEPIAVKMDVKNDSNFDVLSIRIGLIEKTEFKCNETVFASSEEIVSFGIKDSVVRQNTTFSKIVTLQSQTTDWKPTIKSKHITVNYFVSMIVDIFTDTVDLVIPLKIVQYCPQYVDYPPFLGQIKFDLRSAKEIFEDASKDASAANYSLYNNGANLPRALVDTMERTKARKISRSKQVSISAEHLSSTGRSRANITNAEAKLSVVIPDEIAIPQDPELDKQIEQANIERAKAEKEKVERERREKERREKILQEKERLEKERITGEKSAQERLAKEKAEQERQAREKIERDAKEKERLENQRKQQQLELEKAEAQKKESEEKLHRERVEQERMRSEDARVKAELEEQRLEAKEKEEASERERRERERLENEKLQQATAEEAKRAERLRVEEAREELEAREREAREEEERKAREGAIRESIMAKMRAKDESAPAPAPVTASATAEETATNSNASGATSESASDPTEEVEQERKRREAAIRESIMAKMLNARTEKAEPEKTEPEKPEGAEDEEEANREKKAREAAIRESIMAKMKLLAKKNDNPSDESAEPDSAPSSEAPETEEIEEEEEPEDEDEEESDEFTISERYAIPIQNDHLYEGYVAPEKGHVIGFGGPTNGMGRGYSMGRGRGFMTESLFKNKSVQKISLRDSSALRNKDY